MVYPNKGWFVFHPVSPQLLRPTGDQPKMELYFSFEFPSLDQIGTRAGAGSSPKVPLVNKQLKWSGWEMDGVHESFPKQRIPCAEETPRTNCGREMKKITLDELSVRVPWWEEPPTVHSVFLWLVGFFLLDCLVRGLTKN